MVEKQATHPLVNPGARPMHPPGLPEPWFHRTP